MKLRWPLCWKKTADHRSECAWKEWTEWREDTMLLRTKLSFCQKSNSALRGVVTKLRAERDELKAELAMLKKGKP